MTDHILDDEDLRMYEPLYSSAERFLRFLVSHNRTPATIRTYKSILRTIIKAIVQLKGPNVSLDEIGEDDIYTLVKSSGLKETTMKQKLCVLGSWIEYESGRNPVKKVDLLWNREEVSRRFITLEQFGEIYSNTQTDLERVILLLGAELGLRRHEIVSIKMEDIKDGKITIHGKGHGESGKIVVKKIPERSSEMIGIYVSGERLTASPSSDRLLIQNKKHKHPGEPITDSTIDKMCQRLSDRSGIKFSPHDLRRLYCMTLARECGLRDDLDTLRRMMRHESIDTTLKCYLDAFPDRIEEAEDRLDLVMSGKNLDKKQLSHSDELKRNKIPGCPGRHGHGIRCYHRVGSC